ncbi:porin family protein [Williamwhitmania taraxaci]|uniref:Outer membrane protein beta-barrel domain-containing protein n=1 Tax=Williamwhitmania taraxaci TaxID=1640674 RepID=A0A1G6LC95_9BACT|nr:porin family protein [Williamwhitmania taraxaci]SDC41072.1 Outer membrane protein beta-barrel domain-containing protein [Williamwhitmania taraxaci]
MKVKAVLLVAFAFVAMNVNGQDLKFGAKGGLNFANMGKDANTDMRVGFHVGGFAQYGINESFMLQPEVLISLEGAKADMGTSTENLNLTWLNIPIMGVYKIGAVQGLSLEAGPQLGFLMSAKYDGHDIKDGYKSVNISLNLGAGYAVNEQIGVGLRYCIGLSDLNDTGFNSEVSQNNFQLSVAYKF